MRSKYGAKRTVVDGITFASKAEAQRYCELRLQEQAGVIVALELQVKYPLYAPTQPHVDASVEEIGSYVADFVYNRAADDVLVVEDVKGFRTPLYKWKAKHFKLQHGFPITEIGSRKKRARIRGR